MAVDQSYICWLTRRYREQAPFHISSARYKIRLKPRPAESITFHR